MPRILTFNPVARAILVVGAVAALVTGVTFAALSSSATLSASTITSATASLLLWDGDSFESSAPGFTVTELVPGEGSGPLPFYFKNDSAIPLNIAAHVPALPTLSDGLTASDVLVTISNGASTCLDGPVETTLADLFAGDVSLPCNPLSGNAQGNSAVPGTEGNYNISFDINPDAPTGGTASVEEFDIIFTGTQPSGS